MKLATYKDGSRNGQLVVVSRDLGTAHYATGIAQTLQQVLDDWNFMAPQLQDLSVALNQGRARHAFPFDPCRCMAPLPRAHQWLRGAAFPSHAAVLRQAGFLADAGPAPLLGQGCPDGLLGATDEVLVPDEHAGIDFEAGLAVLAGDVPQGCAPAEALERVRLLMLVNDVVLRQTVGVVHADDPVLARPATACSPVAVTPDELGDAWHQGRVGLALHVSWNGRKVGLCEAGEMGLHFGQLLAQACKARPLHAGAVVGSGAVSNPAQGAPGQLQWPRGCSCILEKRAFETVLLGAPSTAYLQFGDSVRVEMKGRDGHSLFGALENAIAPLD